MSWTEKQYPIDKEHMERPQVGDVWREMFSPYFMVAAIVENGFIVYDKTVDVDKDHYKFDETKPKFMTLEDIKNKVTYKTMRDKFIAHVTPCKE